MSIQDRNVLTLNNISQQQNRKRIWEVQNDPSRVEDSALTFDYVKSLALINQTDEEDHISREASTKILQIEWHISSLHVASVKRVNLVDFDFESQPSQMGPTAMGQTGSFVVGRSDPSNIRTGGRTWNPANELTLQSQPFGTRTVYTMSPGSQTSQAAEDVGLRNQHNYMPEETYDYFHSGVAISNSNTNRPLYREKMDKKHMDKKEVIGSEIIEWLNPTDRMTIHGRYDYEYQEVEFKRENSAVKMYKDQMNHYKGIHGKHEIVKPVSMFSPSSQSLSDSLISSSNIDTISQSESESQSESRQGSTSSSDSEGSLGEVYSGSSGSGEDEESESVMYSLSSQDHSPDISSSTDSSESEPKLRKTVPKKGQKSGIKKEMSMSSSSETAESKSNSKSKSKSWKMVLSKGHKHGNKKAPGSSSSESLGSESKSKLKSKETIPTKGHEGRNRKEPKRSSSESSGSESKPKSKPKSKEIIPTKVHKGGNKKELKSSSSESSGAESNSKPKSLEIVPITGHKRGTSESSVSKSKSKKTIATKDHKKDAKNETKMNSSSECLGSKSRKMVPTKNHKSETKKELKIKQVGRFAKLKDKLAIIFHHHHHHHPDDEDHQQDPADKDHHKHPNDKDHHHNSDDNDHHTHPDDHDHHKHPDDKEHHHHSDNKDHHKKTIWKKTGKAFGHKKQKMRLTENKRSTRFIQKRLLFTN